MSTHEHSWALKNNHLQSWVLRSTREYGAIGPWAVMIAYECSRSRTHDCSWALTSPYKGCLSSIAAAIELGKHFIPSRYGVYQECRLPREGSQIQMIQGKNFCWLIVITSFTLSSLAQDSCNCCNIIFYCKFSTFDAYYVFCIGKFGKKSVFWTTKIAR